MSSLTIEQALQLAMQQHQAGQLQQAEAIYRQVLQQQPDNADALYLLGMALLATGRLDEAEVCQRRIVELRPDGPDAYANVGLILHQRGRFEEALPFHQKAVQLNPKSVQLLNNLGGGLRALGRIAEAEACYRHAIALQPDFADTYNNYGTMLNEEGRNEQAIECYRQVLALRPDHYVAHFNLGNSLRKAKRFDEAAESYKRALSLNAGFADAWYTLSGIYQDQGRLAEAIACIRRGMELRPDHADYHSTLLFALYLDPTAEAATLREEHQRWAERHARPLMSQIRPHANDRNPDRRLRIGYVSPDFGMHVVGTLMQVILSCHDRRQFEIVCYSDLERPDPQTARLKGYADLWRDTRRLNDEQFAEQIRQDRIDILVDLAVHSAHNRLLVFARKPAPVQVTYLGYAATTGLEAIDYRITDNYLNPPEAPAEGPEQLVRLPNCYWCYPATDDWPPPGELPALKHGRITFGSFNSFAKVNQQVIGVWAELLRAVPQSQLLIVIPGGTSNAHVWQLFEQHGVARQRIQLLERRDLPGFVQLHQETDIALDPFPYNGAVTTLDSLWMGVPVIALAGQRALARAGVSILSHLGVPELIARDAADYVRIGVALANDLPRLAELRRTLRQRMRNSCLTDGPGFTRGLEAAYRRMWQTWCGSAVGR